MAPAFALPDLARPRPFLNGYRTSVRIIGAAKCPPTAPLQRIACTTNKCLYGYLSSRIATGGVGASSGITALACNRTVAFGFLPHTVIRPSCLHWQVRSQFGSSRPRTFKTPGRVRGRALCTTHPPFALHLRRRRVSGSRWLDDFSVTEVEGREPLLPLARDKYDDDVYGQIIEALGKLEIAIGMDVLDSARRPQIGICPVSRPRMQRSYPSCCPASASSD